MPSCTSSFEVFSICFLWFLETFLRKVTNYITWTLPLLWFMKSKLFLCNAKLQWKDYHHHFPPHFRAMQVPFCTRHRHEPLLYAHVLPQPALQGEMAACDFPKMLPHWMVHRKHLMLTQNAHWESFDCQVTELLQLQHAATDSQFTKLSKP